MKTKSFIAGMLLAATMSVCAATNDLTSALQKGLFEEEANHNLDAAAQAYQTVSAQFDKDRKLAATAIFRLGEVYRKQGKTNEATVQYERIVREFSDQSTLVTLSRQNLAGMGVQTTATVMGTGGGTESEQEWSAARVRKEIATMERELAWIEKTKKEDPRIQFSFLATKDDELRNLLRLRGEKERRLAALKQSYTAEHSEVKVAQAELDATTVAINERIEGTLIGYRNRLESLRYVLAELEKEASTKAGSATTMSTPVIIDDEEKEIRRIQAMIQNSPDLINAKDQARGATPLHNAAGLGQLTVAKFLLANGADVEAKDRMWNGGTPLHYAADAGHKGIVELLLSKGADGKAGTSNGDTPLHFAARKGFKSIVEVLLAGGADVNAKGTGGATPLHVAAVNGFKNVAETLLKAKADPNVVTTFSIAPTTGGGSYGGTPIHIAISRGDRATWELLLANGAEVNLQDSSGRTPLREAVENEQVAAVETLLAKNADVKVADSVGTTPLLVAVDRQRVELVKILLEHQADPEAAGQVSRRQSGNSTSYYGGIYPLQVAVEKGNLEILKLLLERGVDVNSERNVSGTTFAPPIWSALSLEKTNVLKLLLQFKADPNVVDWDGQTPLLRALSPLRKEVVEILLAAGADVKPATKTGWTALHFAVAYGQQDLAALLLAKGADPNTLNVTGQTPLALAKSLRAEQPPPPGSATAPVQWEEIIALLKQHGALDDVPDFTAIRITRQGWERPYVVFRADTNGWNRFTLLEVVMNFYGQSQVIIERTGQPPANWLPFPYFARLIIRRPNRAPGGKEKEIKVNLLNVSNRVDCANDVPLEFGDVVEIPERVHALNELPGNSLNALEASPDMLPGIVSPGAPTSNLTNARIGCLYKSVKLLILGQATSMTVFAPKEGWLTSLLQKPEARSVLRSSSDLSRVKVERKDPASAKRVELIVNVAKSSDDLWLRDGDVIEVPDKP